MLPRNNQFGFTPLDKSRPEATGVALGRGPRGRCLTGFTLIEVLVALGLLVVISLGVMQLLVRSKQVADAGEGQFVAVNLAREGLELVRAVRDTNWFATDRAAWITENMCDTFTYDIDRLHDGEGVGSAAASALFIQTDGHWSHAVASNSAATVYSRVLEVDCGQREGDTPQVEVTSRVSWDDRGQPREVVLKERLYNWLP